MGAGDLIGLLVFLVSMLAAGCGSLAAMVVPLVVTALVFWFVVKQISSGSANLVIHSPLLDLAHAASVASSGPAGPPRLKQVSCASCGARQQKPPTTAYVYCNFCGALTDWDFQQACRAGQALPGPKYEALQRTEKPIQDAAVASGDARALQDSFRRVFDAHMDACPASYSPRLNDPAYRARLLEATVSQYALAALDTRTRAAADAMQAAVDGLQWHQGFGQAPRVRRESFDTLLDAVVVHTDVFVEATQLALEQHPDHIEPTLGKAMTHSVFAQGWMRFVDPDGQDHMIATLGLDGTYVDVPEVDTTSRHCGGCGADLQVLEGATRVLCEHCGFHADVSKPEIDCTGCGAPVSIVWSKDRIACPHCSAELVVTG